MDSTFRRHLESLSQEELEDLLAYTYNRLFEIKETAEQTAKILEKARCPITRQTPGFVKVYCPQRCLLADVHDDDCVFA